ncbi:MAG: insulinase family protein [Bacteroidales bacterium]|nr:insulinase family protein [Bacteroidales bacterium]
MKRIFVFFAAVIAATSMFGQNQLPNDPDVRKGQLENGLTYYIRHNDKPAGRAEFYLATNVGAIQETPDQDGLAHFLEHMCFNGTKNLPGKQMLEYLQKIGAEFGRNINAQTGVEQTTYMLNNIPVTREGIIDTCILIMHDYSHFVTCDPVEIDKERGVIIEEKRSRNTASWRMFEKSLPYYYGDSKYSTCTLIGSQENLETFRPESLTNFYHTWYRPDMQAVIVVGDIDVDQIEAKIRERFSDIPAAVNPKQKEMHRIPDNEEPVIGIITDPEATNTELTIFWKSEPMPEELNSTDMGFFTSLLEDYIYLIMSERFNDITSRPGAPFINASLGIGELCETCEAVFGGVACKDGEAIAAFKAFLTEVEKMKKYGFTDAEVQRAKDNLLRMYEQQVEGAESRKNSEFIDLYINNFFDNKPYMTPEAENEIATMFCSQINAQLLNQVVSQIIPSNNLVIVYKAPEKDGLAHPSEADFLAAIAEVEASEIEANAEEQADGQLLDPETLKGSAIKKEVETIYGATEWTLKNGVKVVVLPTEYKKDQVMVTMRMEGGETLIPTEDLASFEDNVWTLFQRNTGVSEFSSSQLSKMLAGKSVSVSPYISSLRHGFTASSSPKDLETAFQLMYLEFTDPRFDADEFNIGMDQIKAVYPNIKSQPNFIFQQEYTRTMYGDDPRIVSISEEVIGNASLATIERVYRQLFKDAAGATVFIVGNVDLETLKPLVEKYIGSLPKGKKATKYIKENTSRLQKGKIENVFEATMQTPMNTVLQVWSAYIPYSFRNQVVLNAASYILDMIYTDTLREEEGGTYGASAYIGVQRIPEERAVIQVYFNTNPDQVDNLRKLAVKGLEDLAANGPTEEQLTRTIENFKKNIPEERISNKYWMEQLQTYYSYGVDEDALYEAAIGEITAENIKSALQEILSQGNFIEVVMGPKAE